MKISSMFKMRSGNSLVSFVKLADGTRIVHLVAFSRCTSPRCGIFGQTYELTTPVKRPLSHRQESTQLGNTAPCRAPALRACNTEHLFQHNAARHR
jgi:hypothetical protein